MEEMFSTWSSIAIVAFALSPIFISIFALGYTIWAGREMQKHNRLSVRPHLSLRLIPGVFEIRNSGLGPAEISSIKATVDNEEFDLAKGGSDALSLRLFPSTGNLYISSLVTGMHISAGDGIPIVAFENDPIVFQDVDARLATVEMKVEYKSMYGEQIDPAEWLRED